MARKYELINDLYDQIIVDVTKDARAWQSFLRTACRNYKLRFDEQLLLFAQRPDAIAVLEIERWNTAFGRWVNRGAKGIAVFEDSTGKSQRLKYYFDIADTHGTEQSREVPVWKMSEEYQSDVTEALKNTFGTLSDLDSLESVIKESVSNAVDDNIDDYIYNFIRNGTGSEIDYISTDEAEEIYKRLVKNSVVYMISERLGADSGLTESDFEGIEYFSTHELLNSIGYATSDIAKMGLGVVAKTVRAIEKENQQAIMPDNNISYNSERSSNYERNHLHNAGRLSDSGSDITGTAGGNTRQMGTDEKGISEAAPQDNVLQSDDELSVNTVPRRNGTESAQTGGRADQRDVGKTGADRRAESERYDEMGSADEQSQARSSRDSYSADNNERLSNIKPLPSINEQTAFIAEYEAEVTKASAFSVSPGKNSDDKFRYQLLSRMQSDCNYMLGNGGAGAIRYLDGENVDTHIHNMLELYNSFSDNAKPEWISVEEIEGYREKLTALVAASGKEIQQNSVEKAESQKPEIPSDVDKFYVQPEIEQVTWIYYNPDSAAGGQLVYNYLTYDDIFNAVLKDDPMEYLLENCKQETLDRGSAGFDGAVEEFMTDSEDISSREENYVGKLLALTEPRYAIYQLKDGEELRDYRFTNSEYMQAHGMYADRENYNQVYRGRMQENETLEDIFAKFNVNRPEDFHGHSLSVSDIICVKQNGKITAHFVDSVGFKEVPDFTLSREERKVRRTLTDNLTLLADNQLARDEMDTLADKLFNYEKAQKYSGTSSRWLIGAGKTADKFEDITTRYHNGEDVRAELAKGMYGKLNHIEFFGSKDGIDDVDISATKSEESITFRTKGGFEVTHSWETLGEALITAAKQEYDRHEELDRQFGTQEKTPEIIAEPVHDTADFDEIPNDISDKEQKPVAPAWEQRKKSKVKSFDLHPDVPMSERNNFDLRSNPVEQVGKKERFRRNAEAIKVLKECKFENRFATPEEQLVLSKYVGWGGLPEAFDENNSAWANEFAELYTILSPEEYAAARESTLTAFYTPPDVINAIYKAMEQMGFKEGNLLEPSCGIGNFIGMLPKSMKSTKIYGVEIDTISAGIAQQLYQKSSIAAQGFEEVNVPDSFFDGVIGNVPFGDFKVLDKRYDKYNFLIHDYFFAKSLDKLRPGGIMALVTSKGTMEKTNSSVRKYIAQRAELLGAIKLPNNTFKGNAGTEVVSDILFLQKRDRLVDIERDWVHLDTDENGITMNSYFVQNPEMILGEMKTVSGRFGEEVTCVPFENADLSELLSEAVANIHGEISEYEVTDELEEEDNSIPANPTVRNFSYTVVDDKIYFRENSRMSPIEVSATAENRIKGMIGIRDCVRNLIELQSEDYPDEEIKAEQAKLNAVYDTYVKKYGHINSRANKSAFGDDSSFALLSALEIIGNEGDFERKADIFFKRTIMPHKPVTQVDTASEALAVSIGEKAIIDMEYMKRLTGKEEDEIFNDLKGVIFLNPLYNGNDDNQVKYFMADEYLSGNVREKLAIAKKFAEADSSFNINIEALGKVQPEDLTASEISVRLGSTWLPVDIVQQFIYEFLNTPGYAKSSIIVHYSKYTGEWSIDGKSYDRSNVKAYNTYGSSRINAYKIIEETLNLKDVRIFDYVEDIDGSRKPVLNKKETLSHTFYMVETHFLHTQSAQARLLKW